MQASSWCVLKFGGTSLAGPALWARQLDVLRRRLEAGERPLLVYSAIGETTDDLEGIPDEPPDRRSRVLARIRERHLKLARGLGLDGLPEEVDRQFRDLAAWIGTRPAGPDWDPPSRATLVGQGELLSTRFGRRLAPVPRALRPVDGCPRRADRPRRGVQPSGTSSPRSATAATPRPSARVSTRSRNRSS